MQWSLSLREARTTPALEGSVYRSSTGCLRGPEPHRSPARPASDQQACVVPRVLGWMMAHRTPR